MDERSKIASAAGWYPDPTRRSEFRYFNGDQWTADVSIDGHRFIDHLERPGIKTKSRTLAVLAFIFGMGGLLIAWVPFLFVVGALAAIAAGVLGILALRAIRRNEALGRGFAIAGLVTGGAALGLCTVGFLLTRLVVEQFVEFIDPGPVEAVITDCTSDGLHVDMAGTVDNRDDRAHDYVIVVEVGDRTGERATSFVRIDDVAPGEQRTWTYRHLVRRLDDDVQCSVESVNGPFPFGLIESSGN